MKTKMILILIAAVLIAAFSQLCAELPAPLISVDTLCHMNNNQGNAKGAVFMPDGKTIIGIMDDTPIVIDALTGKEIRRLDSIPKKSVESPQISKDGRYLFAESDLGLAVWNIQTGKILKYLRFCADYCLSPDGTKLYETIDNDQNNTGVIRVYDLNTIEEIEIFCGHDFWGGGEIAISPDGQALAVCVSHDPIGYKGDNINRSVILIDLNKKNEFTKIESMTPWITDMQFSPDGKNLTFKHTEAKRYIAIYDLLENKMNYMYDSEMINLLNPFFNFIHCGLGRGYFLNENTIEFNFGSYDKPVSYEIIWDLTLKKVKNLIKFGAKTIDKWENKLLYCDYQGNLAILDLAEVSVKYISEQENSLIQYSNNQFEYLSNKSYIGESIIYDTTGKMIANLGQKPLVSGKNIIRINLQIPNGVYILTIKNGTEQSSYKFLVE